MSLSKKLLVCDTSLKSTLLTSGYNAYRKICRVGSGEAKSWSDLEDLIPKHRGERESTKETHSANQKMIR